MSEPWAEMMGKVGAPYGKYHMESDLNVKEDGFSRANLKKMSGVHFSPITLAQNDRSVSLGQILYF